MTETFSFSATISSAWKLIKQHAKFLVPAILATAAIMIVMQILQGALDRWVIPSLLMTIISVVVGIAITLGWANILLRLVRGASATWHDFKTNYRLWGHYVVAQIIYSVFVVLALIVALVPVFLLISGIMSGVTIIFGILLTLVGIVLFGWLVIRYMFIPFVTVDHPKTNGWKLLQASAKLTKGHMFDLLGFMVCIALINLAGLLFFFVGLVITVPLTKVAKTYVYEYLKSKQA